MSFTTFRQVYKNRACKNDFGFFLCVNRYHIIAWSRDRWISSIGQNIEGENWKWLSCYVLRNSRFRSRTCDLENSHGTILKRLFKNINQFYHPRSFCSFTYFWKYDEKHRTQLENNFTKRISLKDKYIWFLYFSIYILCVFKCITSILQILESS